MDRTAPSLPPGILRASTPEALMATIKIILEKHADGYVAYPLGMNGAVTGQGETYEAALADVRSALAFHVESFGADALEADSPVLEAFVAETELAG
jgi:predicted RNase H-like HicB family nuclease